MYSATVWTDPQLYASQLGGAVDDESFLRMFQRRTAGRPVLVPFEMDKAFVETLAPELEPIRTLVLGHRLAQLRAAEAEIASQSGRLADAQERSATMPSRALSHSVRIAKQKISAAQQRRARLARGAEQPHLGRMFPGHFVPLLTLQEGRLLVKPMRYKCRPSHVERRMATLLENPHHARKDGLEGRWRLEFGHTHGVLAVESLFESVSLHRLRHRTLLAGEGLSALELEYFPIPGQTLYVPCLWAHWQRPGQPELDSFATIIDRAPPEVQATGQEWCPVFIKREHIGAWLAPDPSNLGACHAILDDRPDVRFEHLPSSEARERLARPAPAKINNLWSPSSAAASRGP